MTTMAVFLVLFPAIFSVFASLSESTPLCPQIDSHNSYEDQPDNGFIYELHEMKLKIARLEVVLEESIKNLNSKSLYLEDREKLIDKMGQKIHDLQSARLDIKSFRENEKAPRSPIKRETHQMLKKDNFDLHALESKAQAAEDRLEVVRSQVQKTLDSNSSSSTGSSRSRDEGLEGSKASRIKKVHVLEESDWVAGNISLWKRVYLELLRISSTLSIKKNLLIAAKSCKVSSSNKWKDMNLRLHLQMRTGVFCDFCSDYLANNQCLGVSVIPILLAGECSPPRWL